MLLRLARDRTSQPQEHDGMLRGTNLDWAKLHRDAATASTIRALMKQYVPEDGFDDEIFAVDLKV